MKNFSKNRQTAAAAGKQTGRKHSTGRKFFFTVAFLFTVFCLALYGIRLKSQIDILNLEEKELDNKIESVNIVINNEYNRKEQLCQRACIMQNITRFNLKLVPRKPQQITYMKRFDSRPKNIVAGKSGRIPSYAQTGR